MTTFKKMLEEMKNASKATKMLVKSGAALAVALYTAAVVFYIAAGRGMDYYTAMQLSDELAGVICPSLGVIGLGIMLFESVAQNSTEQ